MRVGFGKRDITPEPPFPLAGFASRKERTVERVRDPLFARALAFSDGERTAAVASVDVLLVTPEVRLAVEGRLAGLAPGLAGLLVSATHTHSSFGGYWIKPSAALFLGAYRPALFDRLVSGVAAAVADAVADLAPAVLTIGEAATEGLNYNRRHRDGAIDRARGVVTATRARDVVRLITFGAHPVVVAFRDTPAASSDYPGELIRSFEAEGEKAIFVVGPVGGVNVLYPEGPMDVDVHLALLGRLLRESADRAIAEARPVGGSGVAFAAGETPVRVVLPRLFTDDKAWLDALAVPLRLWMRRFGRGGLDEGATAQVPVLRAGDLVLPGFPADLGAGVGMAVKELIRGRGLRPGCVASQTGGYVGYVHLPPEYGRFEWQDKSALWMNVYENGMAFAGRAMGEQLLAAFGDALARV